VSNYLSYWNIHFNLKIDNFIHIKIKSPYIIMYSIIEICKKGYKVRYASNDLEQIHKKYKILNHNINNKLYIVDDTNNKLISYKY